MIFCFPFKTTSHMNLTAAVSAADSMFPAPPAPRAAKSDYENTVNPCWNHDDGTILHLSSPPPVHDRGPVGPGVELW
jgi:hypothetical protein